MGRNIDDFVEEQASQFDPAGEEFRDEFLQSRPKSQWPAFIDEIAGDIVAGVSIGNTTLGSNNFPEQVGEYYADGMRASTGENTDLDEILNQDISAVKLGKIVYQLNELQYEIHRKDLNLNNIQQAIEAIIEKILTRQTQQAIRPQLSEKGGSMADISIQLFSNPEVAKQANVIVDEFSQDLNKGLLPRLDEPQMMTVLWENQSEALQAWCDAGFSGYADMATATGKTVLGLAAIAIKYGELHPVDENIEANTSFEYTNGTDRVLIVAHNDLILEQWRREFDRHLNIPPERTHRGKDISLDWGRVHFRTAQGLKDQDFLAYDLAILDEAHHYTNSPEWGQILEKLEGDVLALSGSVDDAGVDSDRLHRRLESTIGPQLIRYTINQAQADGIIPAFDWEVVYSSVGDDINEFAEVTQQAEDLYEEIQEQIGEQIDVIEESDIKMYEEVRQFSHTSAGGTLKRWNETFRDLATTLFSRRTHRWNQSPSLSDIEKLVGDHATSEKVLVLTKSRAQVEELEGRLSDSLDTPVLTITGSEDSDIKRDTINEFDTPETAGVLIGTGTLLGEGVDIPRAEVAINMAKGKVNAELVQRIGRVLRNPDDTKHARFYHVVGIPTDDKAIVPREDGLRLLETAARLCSLGSRFKNLPGFAVTGSAEESVRTLIAEGSDRLRKLDANDDYDWPENASELAHLESLLNIAENELDASESIESLLGEWTEYSWNQSTPAIAHQKGTTNNNSYLSVRVQTSNGVLVQEGSVTADWVGGSDEETLENGVATVTMPKGIESVGLTVKIPEGETVRQDVTLTSDISLVTVKAQAAIESEGAGIQILDKNNAHQTSGVASVVTEHKATAAQLDETRGKIPLFELEGAGDMDLAVHTSERVQTFTMYGDKSEPLSFDLSKNEVTDD